MIRNSHAEQNDSKTWESVGIQVNQRRRLYLSRYVLKRVVREAECPDYRGIFANGPAIWGGCVTRRRHRSESWYFSQKAVTVQGGYGTCFCRHGTNFIEHYVCRGTSLIGAASLSPDTNLVAGTGAVSRYKLSWSQKFITVQDLNCVQMRVSGCKNHYKFVLSAGTKAKTVTNNLPILSVLWCVCY